MSQQKFNPYEPPQESVHPTNAQDDPEVSSGKAAYNAVTDLVGGPNIRGSDNKFQAKFIGISIVVFLILGGITSAIMGGKELPLIVGLLIGAFVGLVFGTFASGIYLMIYRGVRHIQGKHD